MIITLTDILVLSSAFFIALYYFGKRKYYYFKDKGVKCDIPALPFFGSSTRIIFLREHISQFLTRNYQLFPEQKYIGIFEFQKPGIFVRDLDIIKQITIKDFEYFADHRVFITEDIDPFFASSLFALQGDKWRDMRATLSPAFTSSKMRNMFHLIEECAKDVVGHYTKQSNLSSNGIVEIEVKNEISKFTNDVIASAAFGYKVNSFEDPDNDFYKNGRIFATLQGSIFLRAMGYTLFPRVMKFFNISFIDPRPIDFLKGAISSTMKNREQHGIVRADMVNLLMEAKKGSLKHELENVESLETGFATVQESNIGKRHVKRNWSDDELVSQAFVFFLAGFDSISTLLTFFIYEMVHHADIQKRLQEEIDAFLCNSGRQVGYNDLPNLKYLDMCITETLRLWPPAMVSDRVCVKPYKLPPPTDSSHTQFQVNSIIGCFMGHEFFKFIDHNCNKIIFVKQDMNEKLYGKEVISIPIYAIHHDPKIFPNPDKFDPERFSDENKSNLNPMAFMPFGVGPRNCIGSRFALMECKIIIFHLLSKFDIVCIKKTQIPLELDIKALTFVVKNGLHVGLKQRIVTK